MARKFTNVNAATVRTFFAENPTLVPDSGTACLGENARGRLSKPVIAAFNDANKGNGLRYTGDKGVESPKVILPVRKPNAKGAKRAVKVEVTMAEARAFAGAKARGRLSKSFVKDAAAGYEAAQGW